MVFLKGRSLSTILIFSTSKAFGLCLSKIITIFLLFVSFSSLFFGRHRDKFSKTFMSRIVLIYL